MHPHRQSCTATLIATATALAACADGDLSRPSSASTGPGHAPEWRAAGSQQRVTGVAFIVLEHAGGALERFTFNAVRHRDGRVSGQFQLFTEQEGGIRLHGTIGCLGIRGESEGELVGHLGGVVTRSTLPELEGLTLIWTVVDLGEGAAARPDESSDLFIATPEEMESFCAFDILLPVTQSRRGNIQVHP